MMCIGVVGILATMTSPAGAQVEPDTLGFTVSPSSGPPGTVVHFEGDVPPDADDYDLYQSPDSAYGLLAVDVPSAPDDCALQVGMSDVHKTVSEEGHVTGSFVVGDAGGCFMSETHTDPLPAYPGEYSIALSCHGCIPIGTFTITSASTNALPRTGGDHSFLVGLGVALLAVGLGLAALGQPIAFRMRSSSPGMSGPAG